MELVHDRGTVMLVPGEGERPPRRLSRLAWDERVGTWRAPAHRYADVVAELVARGVAFRDRVAPGAGVVLPTVSPPLRDDQREALAAWRQAGRRGILCLPTGWGKTHVGLAAIAELARPALVLVPTRVLLAQWARRLREIVPGRASLVGRFGDGCREIRPITVMTFESADRHLDRHGARFALLVVDEVHDLPWRARHDALVACCSPARLGLTATPPEPGPQRAHLVERIGPISFQRSIGDLPEGVVAPFQRHVVEVELDDDERRAYERAWSEWRRAGGVLRAQGAGGSDGTALFARLAASEEGRTALAGRRDAWRIVHGARSKLRALERLLAEHAGERVLVFTGDNDVAHRVSRELLVPALTAEVRGRERERLLADFTAGSVRTLVSTQVLNQGVDLPAVGVGIVLGGRGGASGRREHVQRVGRLLRPAPGKVARVIEVVAHGTCEVGQRRRREVALVAGTPP